LELTRWFVLTHLWKDSLLFSRTCCVAGQSLPNIYGFTSFQASYEWVENPVSLVLDSRKHLEHFRGWHANLRAYGESLSGLSAAVQLLDPCNLSM
jgi:hypothetical protein